MVIFNPLVGKNQQVGDPTVSVDNRLMVLYLDGIQSFGNRGIELPDIRCREHIGTPFCGARKMQGVHCPQRVSFQQSDASNDDLGCELDHLRVANIFGQPSFGGGVLPL